MPVQPLLRRVAKKPLANADKHVTAQPAFISDDQPTWLLVLPYCSHVRVHAADMPSHRSTQPRVHTAADSHVPMELTVADTIKHVCRTSPHQATGNGSLGMGASVVWSSEASRQPHACTADKTCPKAPVILHVFSRSKS